MEFILGCNYWASHAGTEMWINWDRDTVDKDLRILSDNGVNYIRVFPNWRDFQPVEPRYSGGGTFYEYAMSDNAVCHNPYYIDERMIERFNDFCEIAQKYNIKLIVGLITGWMSGRLFIPVALNEKNLYTDPQALMFQQKFIRGFIEKTKHNPIIFAWDLGNECNCMSVAQNRETAYSWSALISNAIKASDPTRPIISGMHTLGVEGIWTIQDQAEITDLLTTHPYPYWVNHCSKDKTSSIRTLLHATAETKFYSSIANKGCLVEELGTMGPIICDDQTAANFMRVNLYSNWANGASGVMWWCANEQSDLNTAPYTWNMCERELGMLDKHQNPKPVLTEMKEFNSFIKNLDFNLPQAKTDAVCILTRGQDHWGIAYMSYILAKQAGMNLNFSYCESDLPDSEVYLLPSISGHLVMNKQHYDNLKSKIYHGATLYISSDGGFLTEFEELTGLRIIDSENSSESGTFYLDNLCLQYTYNRKYYLQNISAEVITKEKDNIIFSVNKYGKGKVYYLNMPLEKNLLNQNYSFNSSNYAIYKYILKGCNNERVVSIDNPYLALTIHNDDDRTFVVIVNYSDNTQKSSFKVLENYSIETIYCGNPYELDAFSSSVVCLKKQS